MIRKVLRTNDPRLREKTKEVKAVDKKLLEIIQDLKDTLKSQDDPPGVGLAAPQIGKFINLFIVTNGKKITTFINPKILKFSKETNDPPEGSEEGSIMEGCLSLPHYYGPVQRSNEITIQYQTINEPKSPKLQAKNYNLKAKEKTFSGFVAQVIQHEYDHLKGVLFIDRLFSQKRSLYRIRGKKWEEVEFV
jgi:peptide deformylase